MNPGDWNAREVERGNMSANELAWLQRFGVELFQHVCGIAVDGYAGEVTRRKARHLIAEGWEPSAVLDMSRHQRSVDLQQCKRASLRGLVLKATEGATWTDPKFRVRYRKASKLGIPTTAYHFLRSTSTPREQAEHFVTAMQEVMASTTGPQRIPIPVLDVEQDGFPKGTDPNWIVTLAHQFSDRFVQLWGSNPVLYTYPSFWKYQLSGADLSRWLLWLARYNRCLYEGKVGAAMKKAHGDRVIAWQWRGFNGLWPGVGGAVDVNLLAPNGWDRWVNGDKQPPVV